MKIRCLGCMRVYDTADSKKGPHCGAGRDIGTGPENALHIPVGTVLKDRYLIGKVLGHGKFGVTYIGFDLTLNVVVAIKEYLPGEFSTRMPKQPELIIYGDRKAEQFEVGKKKFIEEARILIKLEDAPEVVHIFDCFEANSTAYIVMEYLEGETLKKRLEREKKLTVEQSLPIIIDVLHALEAVHQQGILHRDIAPDNIFLTRDGRTKIID